MGNQDKHLQEYARLCYALLPLALSVALWNHHAAAWRWSLVAASLVTAAFALTNFALRSGEIKGRPVAPTARRLALAALWVGVTAVVVTMAGTLVS